MKNLLDRYNGKLGGPGSVSYNFIHSGLIIVKKPDNADESVMLEIIDMGVDDVQESDGVYEIYVKIADLENVKEQLKLKFTIESSDIIQKPVNMAKIETEDVQKVMNFLQALDDHEDVQKVFTNADFPQ
jgi:transcriptional/translational regulatory protein YebC/TACO1